METIAFTLAGPLRAAPHEAHTPLIRIVTPIASTISGSRPIAVSDEELFERFILGEERAFTLLFERYNRKVYYYCAKLVQDAQAAEDITQTMWERIIEMRSHPMEVRNVPGFLFRIARNLALDHLKHRQMQSPLDTLTETQAERDTEISGREEIVLECLEALPLAARELLIWHYYSGYSFEEIAAITGKKPNAIWTRASRARADLKASIEKRITSTESTSTEGKKRI
jgi:RNA polymerase sigma factor (sigma-70 family)